MNLVATWLLRICTGVIPAETNENFSMVNFLLNLHSEFSGGRTFENLYLRHIRWNQLTLAAGSSGTGSS